MRASSCGFRKPSRIQDSCGSSSSKSFSVQYQHHVPCGSCIYKKCSDGQYFEPCQVKIGDDAAGMFLGQVPAAATICRQHLANKIPIKRLTQEKWKEYKNATNCSICAKPFKSADKQEVVDDLSVCVLNLRL